jgi:hypothetical protein
VREAVIWRRPREHRTARSARRLSAVCPTDSASAVGGVLNCLVAPFECRRDDRPWHQCRTIRHGRRPATCANVTSFIEVISPRSCW